MSEEIKAHRMVCVSPAEIERIKQAEKDRRNRLDRFVCAALGGLAHTEGDIGVEMCSRFAIKLAETTLSELERREKGPQ